MDYDTSSLMFFPSIPSRLQTDLRFDLVRMNACLLESVMQHLVTADNYSNHGGHKCVIYHKERAPRCPVHSQWQFNDSTSVVSEDEFVLQHLSVHISYFGEKLIKTANLCGMEDWKIMQWCLPPPKVWKLFTVGEGTNVDNFKLRYTLLPRQLCHGLSWARLCSNQGTSYLVSKVLNRNICGGEPG